MDVAVAEWLTETALVLVSAGLAWALAWGRKQAKRTDAVEDDALVEALAQRVEAGKPLLARQIRTRLVKGKR